MAVKNREYRTVYQDVSAQAQMSAGVDPSNAAIVAADANDAYSVFVQEIRVHITTDAAQTLSFQDTAGNVIFTTPASPGLGELRFRPQGDDDQGLQLPVGEGLALVASAAGLAGWWEVDAYRRVTAAAITPAMI